MTRAAATADPLQAYNRPPQGTAASAEDNAPASGQNAASEADTGQRRGIYTIHPAIADDLYLLNSEACGRLVKALCRHYIDGQPLPPFSEPVERIVLRHACACMDAVAAKRMTAAENGRKGGRPKKAQTAGSKTDSGKSKTQTKAAKTAKKRQRAAKAATQDENTTSEKEGANTYGTGNDEQEKKPNESEKNAPNDFARTDAKPTADNYAKKPLKMPFLADLESGDNTLYNSGLGAYGKSQTKAKKSYNSNSNSNSDYSITLRNHTKEATASGGRVCEAPAVEVLNYSPAESAAALWQFDTDYCQSIAAANDGMSASDAAKYIQEVAAKWTASGEADQSRRHMANAVGYAWKRRPPERKQTLQEWRQSLLQGMAAQTYRVLHGGETGNGDGV